MSAEVEDDIPAPEAEDGKSPDDQSQCEQDTENKGKEDDAKTEDNGCLDESMKRKREEEKEEEKEKEEPPEKRTKAEAEDANQSDGESNDGKEDDRKISEEKPSAENESIKDDGVQNSVEKMKSDENMESKENEENVTNGEDDEKEEEVDKKTEDDLSSAKSEDSEKENRQVDSDMPMDLSTKSSNENSQDVIMLSDSEEEPLMNGFVNGHGSDNLTREEIWSRKKFLKTLQAELRNEEAKLVLLKKLRQSQMTPSQQIQDMNRQSKNSQPPPLVRPGQQQGSGQARPAHSQPPQLLRGNQSILNRAHQQGPPPLVNMRGQNMDNSRSSLSQQMRYQGMPGANPNAYRQGGSNSQSPQVPNPAQQPVDTQTPAQRQAAAKMALRKQLEKTLLQIPPPKPPPPEMNFVPSLSSPDFIYLLGLEEAVNYIIDANLISKGQKNPDEKMVCNPFTCVQCYTDFTPVWKREKVGSKNVICEHCVTTNQKKALKQEHTNRLKSAFVKALQQEQEIERMQAQEKTSGNQSSGSPSPAMNGGGSSSPMSSMMASQSAYKATTETLRQHQNFLQAHQAVAAHQTALRMGQPLGLAPFAAAAAAARGAFPYQMQFGSQKDLTQLQRQYLLDMIPNRGGMPWKT